MPTSSTPLIRSLSRPARTLTPSAPSPVLFGHFQMNQDVVVPSAEGLPTPVDPDGFDSGSQGGRKPANRFPVPLGFYQRRLCTAQFGVHLDLDRQSVVETGIEQVGESGDPGTWTPVVHRSIPASGIRYALESCWIGSSEDVGVDEDRPVIRGIGGLNREHPGDQAKCGGKSHELLPTATSSAEHGDSSAIVESIRSLGKGTRLDTSQSSLRPIISG